MDTLIESILVSRQIIPEESLDDIIESALGILGEDELDALLSEVGCREVVSIVASNGTQNMPKPASPCCLAIQLKTQYMSMLIITGRLWVPRYPIVTVQNKVVSSMGRNNRLSSKVCH